ncbi:MAG TPA: hypothetical protein PKE69_20600 [Pyrinomonadaceae bacterium]|nr:hypothetical protein [Pyrinomonadaceae bacterium]
MSENLKPNEAENTKQEPEIITNDYDSAVVVEKADRTVLLTEQETIVIEKDPIITVVPNNRPRKVYGGMWGIPEITTVGLAGLAILSVLLLYLFFVMPRESELKNNRAKQDELEKKLISEKQRFGSAETTEKRVAELINSVDDFETRALKPDSISRSALYQQINGLIVGYGLTNTTGPDYQRLEITASNNAQDEKESGRAKFQSLFPGDYVTMTVEGSYQNLRRFIRQIETNNQFIVISTIEFEPADSEEKKDNKQNVADKQMQNPPLTDFRNGGINPTQITQATPKPKVPQGKKRGEIVALRLEMAAYYRRPNFVPQQIDKEQ